MEFLFQEIVVGGFAFPLWWAVVGVGGLVLFLIMVFTGQERTGSRGDGDGFGDWKDGGA